MHMNSCVSASSPTLPLYLSIVRLLTAREQGLHLRFVYVAITNAAAGKSALYALYSLCDAAKFFSSMTFAMYPERFSNGC